ncbi:MAG: MarR family transcriptional regulator [Candidatus Thermoplasmatota archaeon]|nr:MarR family transcriptional regulator [Candidatus Thermoplasmatota archaeon]
MGNKSMHNQGIVFITLFSLSFLSIAFPCQATGYYADLSITVDTSGFITIDGLSNYPNITIRDSEMYTSKQQGFWLLNITKQDIFSEYVFDLILPQGASISYIKSSGTIRIEEHFGSLMVKGFGENKPFSILVQYQIEKQTNTIFQENLAYLFLVPSIIVVSLFLIHLFLKEKKKAVSLPKADPLESLINLKGLNHRQKEILQFLYNKNVPLTQTEIQKELQIPKASISRNIRGLERKGLIEKEQIGMSNLIRLKNR